MKRHLIVWVAASMVLAACGGGGGETAKPAAAVPEAPAAPAPAPTPLKVAATSYANAKGLNLAAQKLPYVGGNARGYADFFQRGEYDLFIATTTYDVNQPAAVATPGKFEFWKKQSDGTYAKDTTLLATEVGCLHPRKAAIADYNEDGKPDVFVACHGYDAAPFPGEKSALVLSQPDGKYQTSFINYVAFSHAAAAADVNGDGHIDVVLGDSYRNGVGQKPVLLLGDGKGGFTVNTTILPNVNAGAQIWTIEAMDIDGDGDKDLIYAGGDDGGGWPAVAMPPTIFINDNGAFTAPAKTFTAVPTTHALDVLVYQGKLYVNRTSAMPLDYYKTRTIQSINLSTSAANIVRTEILTNTMWLEWMVPYNGNIISDTANPAFEMPPL